MLSSLLPKSFDFTRATRWALMVSLVGKRKLPCVQRDAAKVSVEFGSAVSGVAMVSSAAAELAPGLACCVIAFDPGKPTLPYAMVCSKQIPSRVLAHALNHAIIHLNESPTDEG